MSDLVDFGDVSLCLILCIYMLFVCLFVCLFVRIQLW